MGAIADETAGQLLDVVPIVMAVIRGHMREFRDCDLSIPQFRTLAYLNREPGASLSDVADYIGLTLPAMSRLIDGLVERKLISRQTPAGDRRKITLNLTARGGTTLESNLETTQEHLAEHLAGLKPEDYRVIIRAMELLRPLFAEHVSCEACAPAEAHS